MKWAYILVIFLFFSWLLKGQQQLLHSWYMWNTFDWNPAWAGMEGSLVLTGLLRKQWVQQPGSPLSRSVNAHMPVYIAHGGAGLRIRQAQLGVWEVLDVSAAWNYQLELGRASVLSVGAAAGMVQRQLDGSRIRTPQGTYLPEPVPIDHQDELLPEGIVRASRPTFDVGIFLLTKRLGAGIAVQHLTAPVLSFSSFGFQFDRTFYAAISYKWEFTRTLTFLPSVWVSSDVWQTQTNISLLVQLNDNIFSGFALRGYSMQTLDAAIFLIGVRLGEQWSLGYSYDMGLGTLQQASNGSHELILRYQLGKPIGKGKLPPIIYNPRDL